MKNDKSAALRLIERLRTFIVNNTAEDKMPFDLINSVNRYTLEAALTPDAKDEGGAAEMSLRKERRFHPIGVLEDIIKQSSSQPQAERTSSLDEFAKCEARPAEPIEPLPEEECKRIANIEIYKHEDGSYGYSRSGMLPYADILKCLTHHIGPPAKERVNACVLPPESGANVTTSEVLDHAKIKASYIASAKEKLHDWQWLKYGELIETVIGWTLARFMAENKAALSRVED